MAFILMGYHRISCLVADTILKQYSNRYYYQGFPGGSAGKESTYNVGNP